MTDQTDSKSPATKEQLLERINSSWKLLMAVVEQLPNADFNQHGPGGWTPKDNLAHLYEWERYMLRRILRGDSLEAAFEVEPDAFKGLDEDGINNLLYLRNKERFPGDVIELLKLTHQAVTDELQALDFNRLLERRSPNNPESPQLIEYVIGNTYEHFDEHRTNIEAVWKSSI